MFDQIELYFENKSAFKGEATQKKNAAAILICRKLGSNF
jgi:hypothetical protein